MSEGLHKNVTDVMEVLRDWDVGSMFKDEDDDLERMACDILDKLGVDY